jgi:hypothetical protein
MMVLPLMAAGEPKPPPLRPGVYSAGVRGMPAASGGVDRRAEGAACDEGGAVERDRIFGEEAESCEVRR